MACWVLAMVAKNRPKVAEVRAKATAMSTKPRKLPLMATPKRRRPPANNRVEMKSAKNAPDTVRLANTAPRDSGAARSLRHRRQRWRSSSIVPPSSMDRKSKNWTVIPAKEWE